MFIRASIFNLLILALVLFFINCQPPRLPLEPTKAYKNWQNVPRNDTSLTPNENGFEVQGDFSKQVFIFKKIKLQSNTGHLLIKFDAKRTGGSPAFSVRRDKEGTIIMSPPESDIWISIEQNPPPNLERRPMHGRSLPANGDWKSLEFDYPLNSIMPTPGNNVFLNIQPSRGRGIFSFKNLQIVEYP